MDLEKVTAKIRPRRSWEAIDLGITLVQNHAVVLYKIWFIISFPVFVVLSGLLVNHPEALIIAFWWLKPILERPLLHFLSRELFGEGLTVKQCVKMFFSVAKIQWFISLTLRRFSFTRSFDLPLIQLEGLKGNARTKRLRVVHSGDSGSAVWLTIIFAIIEVIFYLSIITLIYLMVPDIYLVDFSLEKWIKLSNESIPVAHTFNLLMYLSISLVAPFYVACGFALYLNQRTHLEAWDIELAFKRLAGKLNERSANAKVRLTSWFSVAILVAGIGMIHPNKSYAESQELNEIEQTTEKSTQDIAEEQSGDLTVFEDVDDLDHKQVKKVIIQIKEGEDFHQIETVETNRYRYPDNDFETETNYSSGWSIFANILSILIEFGLWIFIAVLVIFLILRYKHLLVKNVANKKIPVKRPDKLFGLDLNSQNLPDNPWLVAKQMIQENQYREALSLLYRASLIWYIDNSDAVIKEGYTELECLEQISSNVNSLNQNYMGSLTFSWRALAYAHQIPTISQLNKLCDDWPEVMKNAHINGVHQTKGEV